MHLYHPILHGLILLFELRPSRRLRDKIIESERFALAIDVTGKCGLDPGAVWFAWGLSQLKSGDLKDARDNFSKCLTVSIVVHLRSSSLFYLYVFFVRYRSVYFG